MMRRLALLLALLVPAAASAKVLNVEFEFTPFTGDKVKSDRVDTVPGNARVYINNIPVSENAIDKHEVMVLFENREVAPAVWVPVGSLGPVVRRGKNTIRVEFEPADARAPYRAELRWAIVNDQTTTTGDAGSGTSTNQSGEGVDAKQAKGKVVFEHEFTADFAADRPWHHYPAVTTLSDADRKALTELAAQRTELFQPDFAKFYALLKQNPQLDIASMRKTGCAEKAYAAGVRMEVAPAEKLEMVTTGGPAVVVQSSAGKLYAPPKPAAFDKIKGDDAQMCASVALFTAYPPRLVVVHSPSGAWEVVQ